MRSKRKEKLMLKWEKIAKFIITILVLLNFMIAGISILPKNTAAAAPLPSDMPVVFVDPQNITANPGDTFTISVKVFNLSNNYYGASDPQWVPRAPLPPPGSRFNYSLGNLYGFDFQLSWESEVLEYVSHSVKVPNGTSNPDGILYEPIIDVMDYVDSSTGTYWLVKSSQSPAPMFNRPDANATMFTMTFTVKKLGTCTINITNSDLSTRPIELTMQDIPHWAKPAQFQTEVLATRIESLVVGAWVDGTFYEPPVISGEDAQVRIAMINDGNTTDTCNITLYEGTTVLQTWENETLETGERKTFNHTIAAADLTLGNTTINVMVTSVVLESEGIIEEGSKQFTVIQTPMLTIAGPAAATAGDKVSFNATGSVHIDPDGEILSYTWTLMAPDETHSRITVQEGNVTVKFQLDKKWSGGNWTVALEVEDNWGVTYNENRPLTAPYRITKIIEVSPYVGAGIFNIENIALIVMLVVVIAVAVIYLRRRSR